MVEQALNSDVGVNVGAETPVPASAVVRRPQSPAVVHWRTLLGFHAEGEAQALVDGQGVPSEEQARMALMDRAHNARSYVSALALRPEAGVEPIAPTARLTALAAEPTFGEYTSGMSSWQFAMVDLRRLVVFQPWVNTEHLSRLAARLPLVGDDEGLVRLTLPLKAESSDLVEVVTAFDQGKNLWTITSDHLDLRLLGPIAGQEDKAGRKFVGFQFGIGLRAMSAVEFNGRFILKNGYHRAVALAVGGHVRVPMLILRAPSYALTGGGGVPNFSEELVMGSRPPRLEDFMSMAAVDVPRRRLKVVITMQGQAFGIPT